MNADSNRDTIAVLGAGSWGTALGILLARNGWRTLLWGHNPIHLSALAAERCNKRYLPDSIFPPNLEIITDISHLAEESDQFLSVVPSVGFVDVLNQLQNRLTNIEKRPEQIAFIWGTKGFEPGSGRLLHCAATEILGNNALLGVVSGPSFAKEVARGHPTALAVATNQNDRTDKIAAWFRNDSTRVYPNPDLAGVQLGGAIKNIMAIATGISDGLGLGANARAAVITRGLAELMRLGRALGGRTETFMGLAGVGDLILTCTDDQSRNRRLGLALGREIPLDEALADIGQEAEGINTTRELHRIGEERELEMPITEQVFHVLNGDISPREAVTNLLTREPRPE